MGITSLPLQMLVTALAVGALAATVWVWPRLAGRHWSAVLGRMAALLGFYASWSDLLGTDTGTALVTPAGLAAGVRMLGSRQVQGGRIDQVLMPGPARTGEGDYRATRRFLAAVRPPMRASSLILPSGGHNFNTWNRELPQALPWLARRLHAPAS